MFTFCIAINNDNTQITQSSSTVTQPNIPAVTMTPRDSTSTVLASRTTGSDARTTPSSILTPNLGSGDDPSVVIAIVVITIIGGSILLTIVIVISVVIVRKKRKSKSLNLSLRHKNDTLPAPQYETLKREDTTKPIPAIDIELYSTVDYTTMDSTPTRQYEIPLPSNTSSPNKTNDSSSPHYAALNVQALDEESAYTTPLTPPPSPRQPHPTPYSAPVSLTNTPKEEKEGSDIYDYARFVKKVADNDDSEYI